MSASVAAPVPEGVTAAVAPRRARVRANLIANFVGRGWAALAALLFVPAYVRLLGPEAYGLVGIFAVVQAWAMLFDFGLTPTLNREMARAGAGARDGDSLRDLLRSFEWLGAALAIGVAALAWLAAPAIADGWLKPQALSAAVITNSLRLLGIVAALRWLEQLFRAGIQGREDQLWLNLVQLIVETLRWGGAYLVLRFWSADVLSFFGWQLIVAVGSLLALRTRLWRTVPHGTRAPRFSVAEVRGIRAFAGGMFASALLTFALTQSDKLVVTRLLPLGDVGIYMLASTVAAGLLQLMQPIYIAVLPRLTGLVAAGDREGERGLFLGASQAMALLMFPAIAVIAALARPVLLAWTGDPALAATAAPVLALLTLAMAFSAVLMIPYMLQLAHGWPALTVRVNSALIVVLLPALVLGTMRGGMVGAAGALAVAGIVSMVSAPLMFARLLPEAQGIWWRDAVLCPAATAAAMALAARALLPVPADRWQAALVVVVAAVATLAAAAVATPIGRQAARRLIARA